MSSELLRVANRDPCGEHQPIRRRDLDVGAPRPEVLPLGRAHTDGADSARTEVDLGLRHAITFGAEPTFHMLGAAPRLEHQIARGWKGAGNHQGFWLYGGL